MAHVQIRASREEGRSHLTIDGHDISSAVMLRDFKIEPSQLPGRYLIHMVVRADRLDVDLQDVILDAAPTDPDVDADVCDPTVGDVMIVKVDDQ